MNIIKILYTTIILSRLSINNQNGMFISSKKQLHTGVYEISYSISCFEEKLSQLILSHKGDGLALDIYSSQNDTYVDIELIIGEEDKILDIGYILDFLAPLQCKMEKSKQINRLSNFESYIYMQCSSPDELQCLMKTLEEEIVDIEIISESRNTFEHGAGSFFIAYIIGIASSASWWMAEKALAKMSSKNDIDFMKIHAGAIDLVSLKENVRDYTGINEQDLVLISFEEVESKGGNYEIWLRNRYNTIYVISNSQGFIAELKVYEKYKTQI